MAPPVPAKTGTRVSRPAARYRPGKAPLGAGTDDYSDSDDDNAADHHEEEHEPRQAGRIVSVSDLSSGTAGLASQRKAAGIIVNEAGPSSKKIDLRLQPTPKPGDDEDDSSEYETDTDDEPAPAKPVFRKPGAPAPPQTQPESGSSEYETDSSSEQDESEDEAVPPPLLKPIFKPKSARTTIPVESSENQQIKVDPKAKAEEEAAKRRKEAHELAAATIARSLAEKSHAESASTEVDDTDGLDPEAEFAAWRARELARIQRDLDAIEEKRREQAEIEAFKSLPEAEKERLGKERAKRLREEKKEQKGNPAFLQKYYHKGSFFQDLDILKRDYTERTEREVDVSKLPKMMQVRNYGTKGRSKWTHLANEDTSKAAISVDVASRDKGCFVCGGDHFKRDCPKLVGQGDAPSGSGANTSELKRQGEGGRSWGASRNDDSEPRRDDARHRDRSRSPRRHSKRSHRDQDGHRSRESREYDRHRSSKHSREDAREHRHSSSHRDERERDHHRHRHRHHDDDDRRKQERHRSHRQHRGYDADDSEHRSRSDRHGSDDRKHRHNHDGERDRHERRERDDRHRDHDTSRRREHESDRKCTRLDA